METLETASDEFRKILAQQRLHQLSEPFASASAPGAWSPKQILGHLIDSAANNHQRFVRAQIQNPPDPMPGYAQHEWVETQHYQDRPWDELLTLWSCYNRHLLHLMERTPASHRTTLCRIGNGDPVTLEFVMIDYVRHLQHHLRQIEDQVPVQ